jgi:hypothetical protein
MRVAGHAMLMLLLTAAMGCEAIIGLHDRSLVDAGTAPGAGKSGSGSSAGSSGGGTDKPSPCATYCERALRACTGDYAIYHGAADCEPACALLSPEQLQCRDQQVGAALASGEVWDHCQAAALGGSTACGGNCENYCAFMDRVCTDKNRKDNDAVDCVSKCRALHDRENTLSGMPANVRRISIDVDHEGDTLQCRLVHLTIAAGPGAADAHCWHAALSPRPGPGDAPNPCATGKGETEPHCEDYCQISLNACTGDNKVYETSAQCLATCKQLIAGSASDQTGDTVGCRKTHAYNAIVLKPLPHCPHSGPGGAGICGTDCPAYCRLFKAGCEAAFKDAFGTGADANTQCESACMALRGADPLTSYTVASASAKGANPIACRLLYATRALEHPEQQAMLCKSAAGTVDSNCKP